ncbi:hypothetical protein [Streptomyces werraensis]|uniref:hypothetical protein n=1 Tax=Streptomyces werraensis TaxID=68284 RepID=UPI00367E8200
MPDPDPAPHPRRDETASPAGPEPPSELVAAALEAHRALSRGLGQNVPLTALGPDCGVRGLAAFVAVYAAQQEQRGARDPEEAA